LGRELVEEALEAPRPGPGNGERWDDFGLAIDVVEAEGEAEGAVLIDGRLNVLSELGALENSGVIGREHSDVEAIGEEAGLNGGESVHGVLSDGDGDAFDGEALLGVDGLVGGDEGAVLNADDGEGEGAVAGVFGGAGSRGAAGVGGPRVF